MTPSILRLSAPAVSARTGVATLSLLASISVTGLAQAVDRKTLETASRCPTFTVTTCAPLAEIVESGEVGAGIAVAALGDDDAALRLAARRVLAMPGGDAVARTSAIMDALGTIPAEKRGEALLALGELGQADAEGPLAAAVADDTLAARTRIHAAAGLVKFKGEASRLALEKALFATEPRLQETAAVSLGRGYMPDAGAALANRALAEMTPGFVRIAAARALAGGKDARAVPVLGLLLGVPQADVQEAAILGLGYLRTETAIPALIAMLSSLEPGRETSGRVAAIADVLGSLEARGASTPLSAALARDGHEPRALLALIGALAALDVKDAAPAIAARLSETESKVAIAAAEALGQLAVPTVIPALQATSDRGDAALAKALAWAIDACSKGAPPEVPAADPAAPAPAPNPDEPAPAAAEPTAPVPAAAPEALPEENSP